MALKLGLKLYGFAEDTEAMAAVARRADEMRLHSLWFSETLATALNKASVVLDLADEADRRVLLELCARADVLIEPAVPGAMAAPGLAYDDLAARNPALIYCSVTPYGQDGPKATAPAADLTIEAAGGLVGLQGDYDRQPLTVGAPHQASFHAGVQAAAAEIAIALNERGNGHVAERAGNGSARTFPYGAFRCAGDDDAWVAVAVMDDAQWAALAALLDCAGAEDADLVERRARADEIEAALTAWAAPRDKRTAKAGGSPRACPPPPSSCPPTSTRTRSSPVAASS